MKDIPIAGILGDQQAALFGQTCFEPGQAKNTYGTGCFLLMNTGTEPVLSKYGLLTTVAFKLGQNPADYALEGSVAITGALVQWMRDNLGLIQKSSDIETLARTVKDNGGVYFVPAFSGLFAPYWKTDARGVIVGLTRYANKGHLARAVLEATAYQTREVLEAMELDSGRKLDTLRTDGGMVEDDLLMQFQADILNREVIRPLIKETTALGASYAAGLAVGFYKDLGELRRQWSVDHVWKCHMENDTRERLYAEWKKAVTRSFGCQSGGLGSDKSDTRAFNRRRKMITPFLGEFVGTLILILLGDGVVAGVLLKRSKAEASGWIVITAGWALAVMAAVFVGIACGSKDAFLNPAVTLGFAVSSGDYSKLGPYILAQMLGAFAGAILVWLHYLPHWKETQDASLKLAVFCTAPAIRSVFANLISEIIGTFVLVFVVGAIFSKAVSNGIAPGLGPYLVGCLVWVIGLSLGGTTGYAINPARDLSPRIAHAVLPIAGKGSSDWGYAAIPVIGPLAGASLAGLLLHALRF